MFLPLYFALVAASHDATALLRSPLPVGLGTELFHNMSVVLGQRLNSIGGAPVGYMLLNSFIMAILIALGKVT